MVCWHYTRLNLLRRSPTLGSLKRGVDTENHKQSLENVVANLTVKLQEMTDIFKMLKKRFHFRLQSADWITVSEASNSLKKYWCLGKQKLSNKTIPCEKEKNILPQDNAMSIIFGSQRLYLFADMKKMLAVTRCGSNEEVFLKREVYF